MTRPPSTDKRNRTVAIAAIAVGAVAALVVFLVVSMTGGEPEPGPSPTPRPPVAAQQLYVSPTGNDTNDGTQASPLKTIQAALEEATAGTVINLAPGEYAEEISTMTDGAPGAPIVIRGPETGTDPAGRNQAVLRGTGRVVSIDHSYYTLEGFTIDGQPGLAGTTPPTDLRAIDAFKDSVQSKIKDSKLIYIGAADTTSDLTGITINNMLLTNSGGECVRMRNNAHDNTISNSVIQYCGLFGKDDDDGERFRYHNGEGIYIGTSPKSDDQPMHENDASSRNVVTGNIIRTFGSECFNVKENAHDNVFENNECSNNTEPAEFDGSNIELRGHNNVIRSNVIAGSAGWNVKIQSDDGFENGGNTLENNNISGSAAASVRIGSEDRQGAFCGNVVTAATLFDEDGESLGDLTAPCPSGGSAPAAGGPR